MESAGIGCIVLAGGASARLGRDKAAEALGPHRLLEHTLFRVSPIPHILLVVASDRDRLRYRAARYPVSRVVSDLCPGKGPLGGIYTGLRLSPFRHNLVVACDMPFLSPGLLGYMTGLSEGFDVVIPRLGKYVEPLHAVYAASCLEPIADLMARDSLGVHRLLALVRVRYVEEDEIDRFDPGHYSFFNVNTASDLARAREIMAREAARRRVAGLTPVAD